MKRIGYFSTRVLPSIRAAHARYRTLVWGAGAIGCFALIRGGMLQAAPALSEARADAAAFARGCERGDPGACNDLGVTALHASGSDPRVAARAFERACDGGNADGCSNWGALYEHGVGVSVDLDRAALLYERACNGAAALGCSNLGALYARGLGVARDAREARRLFVLACDLGSAAGCNNLMQF